jgi:hypothetical protein
MCPRLRASNRNLLDLIQRQLIARAVIELGPTGANVRKFTVTTLTKNYTVMYQFS